MAVSSTSQISEGRADPNPPFPSLWSMADYQWERRTRYGVPVIRRRVQCIALKVQPVGRPPGIGKKGKERVARGRFNLCRHFNSSVVSANVQLGGRNMLLWVRRRPSHTSPAVNKTATSTRPFISMNFGYRSLWQNAPAPRPSTESSPTWVDLRTRICTCSCV